jgi:DNA-binding transcriptional regulator GbsR (MarR family)
MSIDVDVLSEMYTVLKQYIPTKDRQEAADNLMSIIVDLLGDQELKEFGSTDSSLKKALKEYSADDDVDNDEDSEW